MVKKMVWLGLLVFGFAAVGCDLDKDSIIVESINFKRSKNGKYSYLEIKFDTNSQLYFYKLDKSSGTYNSTGRWNDLIQDFNVTIDGSIVTPFNIIKGGVGGDIIRLSIPSPDYIIGHSYTIEIIYSENNDHKIETLSGKTVNSFSVEEIIEYR